MKKIMVRAHDLARGMEGDYQARLVLALRMAWAESKKEDDGMRKKYERYVKSWYLWESAETRPMTFEEWKASNEKLEAHKAATKAAAAEITVFQPFVEEANSIRIEDLEGQSFPAVYTDEDKIISAKRKVIQRMEERFNEIRRELILAGRADESGLYAHAFTAAQEAILPRKKPVRRSPQEAQLQLVKAGCGHMVRKSELMSASRGTCCLSCYDSMAD